MSLLSSNLVCIPDTYIANSSTKCLKSLPIPDPESYPVITNQACKQIAHLLSVNLETGPWIAGGSVRKMITGESISNSDFDFWFSSEQQYIEAVRELQEYHDVGIVYRSNNAITFSVHFGPNSYKIQLICKKFYSSPGEIINDFDFTCCQIATDGTTVIYGSQTVEDLENRVLRLADPSRTRRGLLKRVIKYLSYGFKLDPISYQTITNNIDEIKDNSIEY